MRAFGRFLFAGQARRRWIHLILGGALAMPYVLVGSVVAGPATGSTNVFGSFALQLLSFAIGLPLAALTSLFPLTRPLEAAAVRSLCGVDGDRLADGPARTRSAKGRTAAWFTLHLGFGGIIAGMSLAVPPFAVVLIVLPVFAGLRDTRLGLPEALDRPWALALSPVAGVAMLVALAACAVGAGALLARWAPALLGPTPEDRLAAAEARAADLAVRNRLARELHDSVGHALSAVTLQASAARRVLDTDPEFVREALAAIEDTTRRTVGELDAVLGVLRDGDSTVPAPTLATDLDGLLRRTRAGGLHITDMIAVDPGTLPPVVSREAYRIVQEGLTNAVKHADDQEVTLHIEVKGAHLDITLENPLSNLGAAPFRGAGNCATSHDEPADRRRPPNAPTRPGSGLHGIADRARLLGGTAQAGAAEGTWHLHVRLPTKGPA
ncbi:histidine kinase [Streptomyces sp. GESEQ-35]|uniref:sensor histidine kinase n=1 Tax=Streptomyces sp. GESEQ-35 TaxID=2812657 RepID=UPI001B32E441|nr:histidine kinase [Streptomyces sp. GESEQ-35]